jgi:exodeoxyribonuclease VIII
MTESAYRGDPRPSITQLAKLDSMPPAHARVAWAKPSTPAMVLGTAVHTAILEPQAFSDRYARMIDGIDRRTSAGKQKWAAFLEDCGDREVLSQDDWDTAQEIAANVQRCDAAKFLRLCDAIEVPRFGKIAGVDVKGRPDAIGTRGAGAGILVEVKTTSALATADEFERAIDKWSYGFQAAGYSMLAEQSGTPVRHVIYIVCETSPPYGVGVFRLLDPVVEWYRPRVEKAASLYATCARLNEWPGHPSGVQEIGLPRWHEAMRQIG